MGVYTFTVVDKTSKVAPTRLFQALCLDNHNILPKVVPHDIKSIEIIEGGTTAVGCVKQFNFAEGLPFKYVKSKINELDLEKFYVKYTNYEGDVLGENVERVVYEAKIEPTGGESHYKMVANFHTKGDTVVTEEEVKATFAGLVKSMEAVEEYLLNNPQVYA